MPRKRTPQFFPFMPDNKEKREYDVLGGTESVWSNQVRFLYCYLDDLGVNAVLVESDYFDWDYLAQYKAFYSTGAFDYGNRCERIHFFAFPGLSPAEAKEELQCLFSCALGSEPPRTAQMGEYLQRTESGQALQTLRDAYCGFVVRRPLHRQYLGRTVLAWRHGYTENATEPYETQVFYQSVAHPCVCNAIPDCEVHIAGITLYVHGLAWQQQDMATGACATVSLWSALQAEVYGPRRVASPDLTRMAKEMDSQETHTLSLVYVGDNELAAAIRQQPGLSSEFVRGDLNGGGLHHHTYTFSLDNFSKHVLPYLRCGIPLLVMGAHASTHKQHVNCLIGFREPDHIDLPIGSAAEGGASSVIFEDVHYRSFYVHDDGVGPNIRVRLICQRQLDFFNEACQLLAELLVWCTDSVLAHLAEVFCYRHQLPNQSFPWANPYSANQLSAALKQAADGLRHGVSWASKFPCAQFVYEKLQHQVDDVLVLVCHYLTNDELEKINHVRFHLVRKNALKRHSSRVRKQFAKDNLFSNLPESADVLRHVLSSLFSCADFLNIAQELDRSWPHGSQYAQLSLPDTDTAALLVMDPERDKLGRPGVKGRPFEEWPLWVPFSPRSIHVAVPEEIVTRPKHLLRAAEEKLAAVSTAYRMQWQAVAAQAARQGSAAPFPASVCWTVTCAFVDQATYFERWLPRVAIEDQPVEDASYQRQRELWLKEARYQLYCKAPLMGRFLGLVRIAFRSEGEKTATPAVDFLLDSTGSDQTVLAHMMFHRGLDLVLHENNRTALLQQLAGSYPCMDVEQACRFGEKVICFADKVIRKRQVHSSPSVK
ncbi:MAG: hypothetical protein HQM06_16960 [Magnetococcales bacterium]|nr:hypothetical protein [Magnetococcales bacterium]